MDAVIHVGRLELLARVVSDKVSKTKVVHGAESLTVEQTRDGWGDGGKSAVIGVGEVVVEQVLSRLGVLGELIFDNVVAQRVKRRVRVGMGLPEELVSISFEGEV